MKAMRTLNQGELQKLNDILRKHGLREGRGSWGTDDNGKATVYVGAEGVCATVGEDIWFKIKRALKADQLIGDICGNQVIL